MQKFSFSGDYEFPFQVIASFLFNEFPFQAIEEYE